MTGAARDPYDVVAEALGCSRQALSPESAMYRDHGWDSFGHVSVIFALEKAYGVRIDDASIEKYRTMKAIHQLYQQVVEGGHRDPE
jgi:acyl carrier protein